MTYKDRSSGARFSIAPMMDWTEALISSAF